MKIVIGYNNTPGADGAIRDLEQAGLPENGEATILTALDNLASLAESNFNQAAARSPALADSYQIDTTRLLNETCATAEKGAVAVKAALPGWEVQAKSRVGTASWLLIHEAEHANADLIVIGSKGHSLVGRILFGSVSHFVVNHAPCSVRVSRMPDGTSGEPLRILAGVDGSAHAAAAVDQVCRRRWPPDTEVRLVAAFDVDIFTEAMPLEEKQNELEKALEDAGNKVSAAGLKVSKEIRPGVARGVLLDEINNWKADCIFLGAIGHNLIDRLLIGSTSAAIAAEAPCSVEIVRQKKSATASE